MGQILYIMGKSASGKDTIYARLLEAYPNLKRIVTYTTRPKRIGEQEGIEYNFTDEQTLMQYEHSGKLVEKRTYQTACGPWSYATIDDGRVNVKERSYLAIGTLESYLKLRDYYGSHTVMPIYIMIDDDIRLERALSRERQQAHPNYVELCRRYLADEEDFSEEKLMAAGIDRRYKNDSIDECLRRIKEDITN